MNITLDQILALVGKLDDSSGADTARDRFRQFLSGNIKDDVGQVRDYIETCLRTSGDQYNRALQDLVNYTGFLLGFDVIYGRYHGVVGQIGFDGHWKSPTGFHLVVEVKTTEVYAINAATLVGYIDGLISAKEIPDRDHALGLYVVGRPDPEVHQLENAIIAERRSDQLRVSSVESLLSLAEMMADYEVSHADILSLLRPSGPTINPLVDLIAGLVAMARLAAEEKKRGKATATTVSSSLPASTAPPMAIVPPAEDKYVTQAEDDVDCWLVPVGSDEARTADDWIQALVVQGHIWGGNARRQLEPGDRVCFYVAQNGVVAHATVRTAPEYKQHPLAAPEKPCWVFGLDDVVEYMEAPIVIDAALRARLDAFKDRDPNKPWAWFVQGAHSVTRHDFDLLTRQSNA